MLALSTDLFFWVVFHLSPGSLSIIPKTSYEIEHPKSSSIEILLANNKIRRRSDPSDPDEVALRANLSCRLKRSTRLLEAEREAVFWMCALE